MGREEEEAGAARWSEALQECGSTGDVPVSLASRCVCTSPTTRCLCQEKEEKGKRKNLEDEKCAR